MREGPATSSMKSPSGLDANLVAYERRLCRHGCAVLSEEMHRPGAFPQIFWPALFSMATRDGMSKF